MKKLTTIFPVILLIVLLISGSCAKYEDLKIDPATSFAFKGFEDNRLKFTLSLPIENFNNYNITITEINLKAFYNNKPLGDIDISEQIIIAKKSRQVYEIPLHIKITNLVASISLMSKDPSRIIPQLSFEGHIKAKRGLFTKKILIDEKMSKQYLGF